MGKYSKRKRRIACFFSALLLLMGTGVFALYRHYKPELTRHSTAVDSIVAMIKATAAPYAQLHTKDARAVYIVRKGEEGYNNMLSHIEEAYGWTFAEQMGAVLCFTDGSTDHEVYHYPIMSLFVAWEIIEK